MPLTGTLCPFVPFLAWSAPTPANPFVPQVLSLSICQLDPTLLPLFSCLWGCNKPPNLSAVQQQRSCVRRGADLFGTLDGSTAGWCPLCVRNSGHSGTAPLCFSRCWPPMGRREWWDRLCGTGWSHPEASALSRCTLGMNGWAHLGWLARAPAHPASRGSLPVQHTE